MMLIACRSLSAWRAMSSLRIVVGLLLSASSAAMPQKATSKLVRSETSTWSRTIVRHADDAVLRLGDALAALGTAGLGSPPDASSTCHDRCNTTRQDDGSPVDCVYVSSLPEDFCTIVADHHKYGGPDPRDQRNWCSYVADMAWCMDAFLYAKYVQSNELGCMSLGIDCQKSGRSAAGISDGVCDKFAAFLTAAGGSHDSTKLHS
eukprot:TRINITY_DN9424_c0_g1_i2.p2 TRINITY_DN9424_c0_g1~~TRINITY_DN9424_c0_g1_i2.p2  ORF type:complete len:205 (+),score=44.65 TRINITY_DN9424_c0_g1_i2:120-734(+)